MIAERDFAGRCWQGHRDYQEDSYLFCPLADQGLLSVVCDGMGGHQNGGEASKICVKVFAEHCHDADPGHPPIEILGEALNKANAQVGKLNTGSSEDQLSGCTLLATIIRDDQLWFISVGDSPLLLFRDGVLYRLNRDHSMRAQLQTKLLFGEITQEEYQNDKTKSMLLSAITGAPPDLIDSPSIPRTLLENDIIILATDGILSLKLREIEQKCRDTNSASMKDFTRELMSLVQDQAGPNQDNTTIVAKRISIRPNS